MRRVLIWIVTVPLALYLALCLAVWIFQDRLVWYPGPPPTATPAAIGAPFEELVLTSADGASVHAWHIQADAPRGAVLVCHGNAGSIEHRLEHARAFRALGYDVLLFDYRGYGRSRGRLSEEGTYLDGLAALEHLAARGFDGRRVALYGESLGGAVAIELARRRPCAALIVEDTFTTLPDVGARVYPWLPVRWLSRNRYASLEKIGALGTPLLVAHSPDDHLVPFAHGERLHAAHPGPKAFLITSGGHNGGGFLQRAEWIESVGRFLRAHVDAGGDPARSAAQDSGSAGAPDPRGEPR
ncbi:MAG: alpha/beta hydrolase [Planctomycetes bacterium]|nr:alpha/beta hydrolase [Planctomycetota bacterium]